MINSTVPSTGIQPLATVLSETPPQVRTLHGMANDLLKVVRVNYGGGEHYYPQFASAPTQSNYAPQFAPGHGYGNPPDYSYSPQYPSYNPSYTPDYSYPSEIVPDYSYTPQYPSYQAPWYDAPAYNAGGGGPTYVPAYPFAPTPDDPTIVPGSRSRTPNDALRPNDGGKPGGEGAAGRAGDAVALTPRPFGGNLPDVRRWSGVVTSRDPRTVSANLQVSVRGTAAIAFQVSSEGASRFRAHETAYWNAIAARNNVRT
ncbi:hypothetical protein PAQ31011_00362 [Pandoraea aquatica]|uniref:Uncharacterized protein n=1 Tax=Pandoraea aquatica TaxID=2508290 RepID=A0A5E4RTC4_9BURK|nr:hypothetical protein PAQ31011_00362 [Pandoraea aquatica]